MSVASVSFDLQGQRIEQRLTPPRVRIGRAPEMDIVVPASVAGVSRHHATLVFENGCWRIEDSGSRNGTFVNLKPTSNSPLKDGDELHLGTFQLYFHISADSPREQAAFARQTAEVPVSFVRAARRTNAAGELSLSISVADVWRAAAKEPPKEFRTRQAAKRTPLPAEKAADHAELEPQRAQAIRFFSEIGRSLLVSESLEEMLENVMIEIFRQVPAERGMIGLIEGPNGDVVPKVVRSDEGDSPIRVSRTVTDQALESCAALLIEDTLSDERFQDAESIQVLRIRSAICVPLYCDGKVHGVIYADTRNNDVPFERQHLEILTALALFSAVGIQQARLRDAAAREQRRRERLSRYASAAVIDRLLATGESLPDKMLADHAEITVLFADMKGFTSLSERKSPEEVVRLLNAIFTLFTQAVFDQQGTLDKFMGDGMLAFFGAPLAVPNHALCAVRTALRMQADLRKFNETLPEDERIGLRIGINTGPAIVGDIGSMARKDYTVIGDTVNVASRFESSVAKVGDIVIGLKTYNAVRRDHECEALPPVILKGKNEAVSAFRVLG